MAFILGRRVGAVLGCALLVLAGCAKPPEVPVATPDADPIRPLARTAPLRAAEVGRAAEPGDTAPRRTVERLPATAGSGPRALGTGRRAADPGPDAVQLNFQQTPVRDAASIVFGQILRRDHVVDAGIDDTLTFRTVDRLAPADVLPVFAALLSSRGLALTEEGGVFRVSRPAPGTAAPALPSQPAELVRLRHVAAGEMGKLLAAAGLPDRAVAVPGVENLLVVRGTAAERQRIADAVAAFDVDAMAGMSSAFVGLVHARAETLAQELEDVFGPERQGPGGGSIRFVPLDRLNGLVVLARGEGLLDRALSWVERLDRAQPAAGRRMHVYNLQNRKAADIVVSLRELLGQGSLQAPPAAPVVAMTAESVPGPMLPAGALDSPAPTAPGPAADIGTLPGPVADKGTGPRVAVDAQNNALLISATAAEYQQVRDLIRQLDITPLQVMIEVSIVEVVLDDSLRFGVQYALRTGRIGGLGDSGAIFTDTNTKLPLTPGLPGFAFFLGDRGAPEVILEALARETDVKVVSSPKLVVLDNQPATLQVGDSVPIIVQQSTNTSSVNVVNDRTGQVVTNAVEYRDTGVLLQVTPRVSNGGNVSLEVSQEVSDVARTTTSAIDSPTIRQRKLLTTVSVRDGQTVMLGGLIQDRSERGQGGIPVLKDIPVLGSAFSNTRNSATRTELVVLLTPSIIATPEDAEGITRTLRQKFRALAEIAPLGAGR